MPVRMISLAQVGGEKILLVKGKKGFMVLLLTPATDSLLES